MVITVQPEQDMIMWSEHHLRLYPEWAGLILGWVELKLEVGVVNQKLLIKPEIDVDQKSLYLPFIKKLLRELVFPS